MRYLMSALFLQLISLTSFAGNISNIFGDGVFGAEWGDTKEQVKEELPGGEENNEFGMVTYEIKDGRDLFDAERNSSDYIKFTFDSSDELMGVTIQFPLNSVDDYVKLLTKLTTAFGEGEGVPNSVGANMVKWREEDVTIGLLHVPGSFSLGQLLLTIEYGQAPAPVSKSKLGF